MEDVAHVIGKNLPELINRTKDLSLTIPLQFLKDILENLKEGASQEDGDIDMHRLCLLVDNEIGCMAMKELDGTQVSHECRSVKRNAISRPDDTEHKLQREWQWILEILLASTRISVKIGKTGLKPSRAERAANDAAHAITSMSTSVTPRKVDCKLVASAVKAKNWEFKPVSNFEMKSSQATSQQVEIRARKNMRLNHSISKKIPSTKLPLTCMGTQHNCIVSGNTNRFMFVARYSGKN